MTEETPAKPNYRFTFEYFRDQVNRFWEMCGDKTFTLDQLDAAWGGLHFVYLNSEGDTNTMARMLQTASENHLRRKIIREMYPMPK